MQHEKKLISHIADRLWGKATSIELVCMRGGKLKYGLGSQMPASAGIEWFSTFPIFQ